MKRIAVSACAVIATSIILPIPAYALPDGFPDLSQFTETKVEHIKRSTQASSIEAFAAFKTPDGLMCMAYRGGSAGCWGSPPDAIPGFSLNTPQDTEETKPCPVQAVGFGGRTTVTGPPDPGSFRFDSICAESQTLPVLPVGEKLTLGNTICVVGENRLTACTDAEGTHGFVVQPSGSWVF